MTVGHYCAASPFWKGEEDCERFQDIGKKIASKCKGLPLAVCVLGSLLQFKSSLEKWAGVLESEIWELEEVEERLFPHLLLSYNQLTPSLKRCFSYCAVFPKDYEIDVDELIGKWIAQGYLGFDVGNIRDLELKGQEYFQKLVMHSLFQDFKRGNIDKEIKSCKMHDIVHDFAQSLGKDRNKVMAKARMKMVTCQRCNSSLVSSVKTYRSLLSYDHPYICDCLTSLRVLHIARDSWHGIPRKMEHLIHLRWLDLSWNSCSKEKITSICRNHNLQYLRLSRCNLEEVPSEIRNLIQLRHLDLSQNISLKELPKKFGNLIQLRHLDLSNNSLNELPEEIGNLIQLKYLNLSENCNLKKLPKSIYELVHLKHIINYGTAEDLFFEGLSNLTGLRTLSEFWGGRGCGKLRWLKNLNLLSGSLNLHIKLTDDSADVVEDAREADPRNKIHICTLKIYFDDGMDEGNDLVRKNVMDALEPHPNLHTLGIHCYKGSKLEGWITSSLFQLRSIELWSSNRMQSLPPLGNLPCLKEIQICDMEGLQSVGREFLGITGDINTTVGFPKLRTPTFNECRKWNEWEDITVGEEDSASVTIMPCLTKLLLSECVGLAALPERLLGKKALSLKYVHIKGFSSKLVKQYMNKEGASWKFRGYTPLFLKVPFGTKTE